jgi:DNA polymerase (family 10)
MRKDIPAGVLELLSVPGLRPEKVLKLYSELGIASLEGLEQVARYEILVFLLRRDTDYRPGVRLQ